MFQNAFFITAILFIALFLGLLQECHYLIPYRDLLIQEYGVTIVLFTAALFINVFTAVYLIGRKVFLQDTGRKLDHLDKQLRSGSRIAQELSRYLEN